MYNQIYIIKLVGHKNKYLRTVRITTYSNIKHKTIPASNAISG